MTMWPTSPLRAVLLAGLALPGAPAAANSVVYQVSGKPMVVVADGGPADLDPAPDRIKLSINTVGTIGGATFQVTGTIIAYADPPVSGKPVLNFSTLTITNTGGNVMGGTMWVQHNFSAIDKPSLWSATMAGRFDSVTNPGNIGGASLNHLARVYSSIGGWKTVVNKNTGLFAGAAPIPFVLSGGPVGWKIASKQRTDLAFYLDSPGDSILIVPADNSRFYVATLSFLLLPAARRLKRIA